MSRQYNLYTGELLLATGEMREVLKVIETLSDFYEEAVPFNIRVAEEILTNPEEQKLKKQSAMQSNKAL